MTTRERFLLIGGLLLGLLVGGVIFGVSRLARPEVSAARTEEMLTVAPESRSENTFTQPG